MILDLFKYFAKFPDKVGVKAMATMGTSQMTGYQDLITWINNLPDKSLIPDLNNYVYGQSLDDLKSRLTNLFGSWLFVDYGEFSTTSNSNSMRTTEKIAITIARKITDTSDQLEKLIVAESTLDMLRHLYAHMISDAEKDNLFFSSRENIINSDIVPFVASELNSVGWTLMIDGDASDTLKIKELSRSFDAQI